MGARKVTKQEFYYIKEKLDTVVCYNSTVATRIIKETQAMPDFQDKMITCVDCNQDFMFEAGEQSFYAQRNYVEPRRCKPCRNKKKLQKAADLQVETY